MSVDVDKGPEATVSRHTQLMELLVFLLLFVPSMVISFFSVAVEEELDFAFLASSIIFRELALTALVLFFVWRNGEGFSAVGWRFDGVAREALLGIGLFIPFSILVGLFESLLQSLGLSAPTEMPSYLVPAGGAEYLLALVFLFVVAVAEETIFRGYLIRRFLAVTRNPATAVIVAALIFSAGHGYQGALGVLTIAFVGVLFGVVYLWRGSLVAPMVMHFIQNFIGVILLPLLGPTHA